MARWTGTRAAAAGLAGTGAVAAAMAWARRAGMTRLEPPRVLATAIGGERPSTRAVGWAVFLASGALLPLGYRAVFRALDVRPGVAAGALLGLAHGLVAGAGAAAFAPLHPRAREAGLTSPLRRRPSNRGLAVLVAVHVLYGAVVGGAARARRWR
jgi:hypothetical protein